VKEEFHLKERIAGSNPGPKISNDFSRWKSLAFCLPCVLRG
jgi:hypothetical protein